MNDEVTSYSFVHRIHRSQSADSRWLHLEMLRRWQLGHYQSSAKEPQPHTRFMRCLRTVATIKANRQKCKDQVYEDAAAFACHVASARRKVGSPSQTSSTDDKGEACSLRAAMLHLHLHDI